jgi:hypothetical protein
MKRETVGRVFIYDYLGVPYNPPSQDSEEFATEWWSVRGQLMALLNLIGEEADTLGNGDYTLSESRMVSRGIAVELVSDVMLRSGLIPLVHTFVCSLNVDYEINIEFSIDGSVHNLFINRDRVMSDGSDEILLVIFKQSIVKFNVCGSE